MENAKKGNKIKEDILMAQMLNIHKDLKKSFSNLIDLIPAPYRYDEKVQRDILSFLKLEGEEFVRNKIEQSKEMFAGSAENRSIDRKDEN
jgi:NMD protein affecting ribosome stability and mRNA decay